MYININKKNWDLSKNETQAITLLALPHGQPCIFNINLLYPTTIINLLRYRLHQRTKANTRIWTQRERGKLGHFVICIE